MRHPRLLASTALAVGLSLAMAAAAAAAPTAPQVLTSYADIAHAAPCSCRWPPVARGVLA